MCCTEQEIDEECKMCVQFQSKSTARRDRKVEKKVTIEGSERDGEESHGGLDTENTRRYRKSKFLSQIQ